MAKTQSWATPRPLYDSFIGFGYFDPCPLNDKPSFDGLSIHWPKKVFINPPYCNIYPWVDRAINHARDGGECFLLLPSRTGSDWFARLLRTDCVMVFPRGRLKFGDGHSSAPFDCVLIRLDHNTKVGAPRVYSMPVQQFLHTMWGVYHG